MTKRYRCVKVPRVKDIVGKDVYSRAYQDLKRQSKGRTEMPISLLKAMWTSIRISWQRCPDTLNSTSTTKFKSVQRYVSIMPIFPVLRQWSNGPDHA